VEGKNYEEEKIFGGHRFDANQPSKRWGPFREKDAWKEKGQKKKLLVFARKLSGIAQRQKEKFFARMWARSERKK